MNDKTTAVFKGWLALTPQERVELFEEINRNRELVQKGNFSLEESTNIRPLNFGPRGEACPCCNK